MHAHTTYSTQNARPGGLCIAAAAALKAAVAKRSIGSGSTSVAADVVLVLVAQLSGGKQHHLVEQCCSSRFVSSIKHYWPLFKHLRW
jgi:hypothetical protein